MKVSNIRQSNPRNLSFKAFKVAQIHYLNDKFSDVSIYSLEKNKDDSFCDKLLENILKSDNNRLQIKANNIKTFLKNAFSSIRYSDEAVLAVKNKTPFGLFTVLTYEKNTLAHLAYLATWKNQNLQKVKNGGSMLINHLFHKFKDNREINLTPAFNSDLFYLKFGFDYENEYDTSHMYIDKSNITKQLGDFTKHFSYEKITDTKSLDLENLTEI